MPQYSFFSQGSFVEQVKKKVKQNDVDPISAARGIFLSQLKKLAAYYGSITVIILAFLAALSFTTFLGGPYVVAQIFFFLYVAVVITLAFAVAVIWSKVKKKVSSIQSDLKRSSARDVNATDKQSDTKRIEGD